LQTNNRFIDKIEKIALLSLLALMLIFILTQFFLRNVFQTGLMGGDTFIRHLFIWVIFMAAGLTSQEDSHLKVDLIIKLVSDRWKIIFKIITDFFSFFICLFLFGVSLNFIYTEYLIQETISFYNIPLWIMVIIIPLGYLVIALRFLRNAFSSFIKFLKTSF